MIYDEKYMKMKFDSDDDLSLNKAMEIHIATIVARAMLLDECSYKL